MTCIRLQTTVVLSVALILGACSGSNGGAGQVAIQAAACEPADAGTDNACGTILIGLTDADGDFLAYGVDITQLTLETANGRTVEVLPASTRVDFTDYIDLTELVAATAVPPATYVAGTISLDYRDAEIFVEAGDDSKPAVVTDASGSPLQQVELRIVLSNRDRLTITRGRATLLQLDFDLGASHDVDITATPAVAIADPYVLAEVHPVDEKDIRVRGPLVAVNETEMNYEVAIRPFYGQAGDFGRLTVSVGDSTEFEIDGAVFAGVDGLRALATAGPGTPTVAVGGLTVAERSFGAERVLGASSVPGSDLDAVIGNIIQRNGNFLSVRGATVVPRDSATDRRVYFHDDVLVQVGPDTRVFKDGDRNASLTIAALSVGQRVTIRGHQAQATTPAANSQVLFDATSGAVRMHVTHLAGVANTIMPGQIDVALQAIDRRGAAIFDFAGTGPTGDLDATPKSYEIATDTPDLSDIRAGQPVVAFGFPSAFGMAPPDFLARTIIDYSDVHSLLGIAWGQEGTIAPFASIGPDGIVLALDNVDIGARHHIKQGPALVNLLTLGTNTTVVPRQSGRMLFSIKTAGSLRLYSDFDDFIADLSVSLNGATAVRAMYARGNFDISTNTVKAHKIGVTLLGPTL